MTEIKFGTDGWRAIIAEDYTFDNVRACAQSVAQLLQESNLASRGMVLGYDTRFGSEHFAAAVAEVMAGNGIRTILCEPATPTPVVSFTILKHGAGGGVVITSSHNPATWNGFKYKPEYAGSASPEVVERIEAPIPGIIANGTVRRGSLEEAASGGLLQRYDPKPAYLAHLAGLIDIKGLRNAGFRIGCDVMFGAGAGYFDELLNGGKTVVTELNAVRNPLFPGIAAPEPIARNLGKLSEWVRQERADVGVATDGDADRLGIVDENGEFVTQLQVYALLTYYFLEVRGDRGPIVKSVTTTNMVNRLGEMYGQPVYETAVGFKYLGPKMMETNALIAGEESGGYGFRGHVPERDGILAGLFFLDLMARTGKRPSQLLQDLYEKVGPHFYDRVDVHLNPSERTAIFERVDAAKPSIIAGMKVTGIDKTDGFRFLLDGGGWLLLRFSGTEPLLRIYTEIRDRSAVPAVLDAGKALAGVA